MASPLSQLTVPAARARVALTRALSRIGFRDDTFLLLLAVIVGIVTAAAAVGFHQLIHQIRDLLYGGLGENLYEGAIFMLVVLPAAGGLAVAVISRYVFRAREGHGIIDVIESVVRSSGVVRPLSAVEKIVTAGVTIGTGGSAGAEGPIVQIGAGIASGVGQLFRVTRQHMPLLIGCGSAAGISAIFNSPIGGVFFTLEVLLQDFSLRTFTPIVVASVIANITTKGVLNWATGGREKWEAIFQMSANSISGQADFAWAQTGNFLLLGLLCGAVAVALIRATYWSEEWFAHLKAPRVWKPALGGAMLGVMGIAYVLLFGRLMLGRPKPFDFANYPLPAFFSDGYGVIHQLIDVNTGFYEMFGPGKVMALLAFLCVIKVAATCATLSSGGSGGIIAPSLFLGATAGGLLGMLFRQAGLGVQPQLYALVGMGAVLAAVVHAPLAAILILMDLTQDYKILLPIMLAAVVATGTARLMYRDSIYTLSLRLRGVRVGSGSGLNVLRRLSVEQVDLEPASVVRADAPFQHVLDLMSNTNASTFAVADATGGYVGLVTAEEIRVALLQREAIPLLLVQDLIRQDIPTVNTTDDLATVLETFSKYEVSHLPVCVAQRPDHVVGFVSRAGLMRRYQKGLAEG